MKCGEDSIRHHTGSLRFLNQVDAACAVLRFGEISIDDALLKKVHSRCELFCLASRLPEDQNKLQERARVSDDRSVKCSMAPACEHRIVIESPALISLAG